MEVTIVSIAIAALLSLLAYLAKEKIRSLEARLRVHDADLKELNKEVQGFKLNYLDRFDKVNKNIHDSKDQIMEKLHALELISKKP